jgi:CBS domain-containing protein/SAM-dependent methyltransferase
MSTVGKVSRSTVRDVMLREFDSLPEDMPLASAQERMRELGLGAIPVRAPDGRTVGILLMRDIRELGERGADSAGMTASEVCQEIRPVDAEAPLEAAFESLKGQQVGRLPVVENGREVGLLTRGDVLDRFRLERHLGDRISNLVKEISPRDVVMTNSSVSSYFRIGSDAVKCIERALAAAGRDLPRRVLDFGCGHGRVLRILQARFPDAEYAACDIDQDGVEFCARVLGATPFVSDEDPAKVEIEGEYDLIWSGSLLTHLDERRWEPFLGLWRSLLAPDGLAVFSVHGPKCAEDLRDGTRDFGLPPDWIPPLLSAYDETGFGYVDYFGYEEYGISICTPERARARVEGAGLAVVSHDAAAWVDLHDVIACSE